MKHNETEPTEPGSAQCRWANQKGEAKSSLHHYRLSYSPCWSWQPAHQFRNQPPWSHPPPLHNRRRQPWTPISPRGCNPRTRPDNLQLRFPLGHPRSHRSLRQPRYLLRRPDQSPRQRPPPCRTQPPWRRVHRKPTRKPSLRSTAPRTETTGPLTRSASTPNG